MTRRNYSNTAVETFLPAGINDSVTSLTVDSASGYPTVPFTIRVESEIILVSAKSGTTFSSLTRGFDGTTAVAHSLGAVVEHRAIANDFSFRRIDPVNDKTSTNSFTDHFDDASLDVVWTQVTPTGTVTWAEGNDVLSSKHLNQTASDCAGLVKTIGALSYPLVVTTAIRLLSLPNYNYAGLLFSNGTTSASTIVWAVAYHDAAYGFNHTFRTGTFAAVGSTIITDRRPILLGGWLYQRLIWRATNLWSYEISPDGVSWTDYANGNETIAMTPTHFGFGVSSWGSTLDQIATFEYFNVTDVLP
jgi:hypothetical protein